VTGGFTKWVDVWSVLITKLYLAVQIKRDVGCVACGGMEDGRDNAGIGLENWGKEITGKTVL
jgi:hypothetical protein